MKLATYFREVKLELSKVVWPKRADVVKLTATVIILSAIVGLYLGALDLTFAKALETFLARQ